MYKSIYMKWMNEAYRAGADEATVSPLLFFLLIVLNKRSSWKKGLLNKWLLMVKKHGLYTFYFPVFSAFPALVFSTKVQGIPKQWLDYM